MRAFRPSRCMMLDIGEDPDEAAELDEIARRIREERIQQYARRARAKSPLFGETFEADQERLLARSVSG